MPNLEGAAPKPGVFGAVRNSRLPAPFVSFSERVLSLDRLREIYQRARIFGDRSIHDSLLEQLDVRIEIAPEDLARIPTSGPVVIAANHPFGMLEGPVLGSLLPRIRPDVKVVTNYLLAEMPELRDLCIFVDPFGGKEAAAANLKALKAAIQWLKSGGMLVMFPSGAVSHWHPQWGGVADPAWNPTVARLIRMSGASAVPLFFDGHNSIPFQVLGLIHPKLRTAALPSQFLNKRGRTVELRVGRAIPHSTLAALDDDAAITNYLRGRVYLLAARNRQRHEAPPRTPHPVRSGPLRETLAEEIAALPEHCRLDRARDLTVYAARAAEAPRVLDEIGRLREITFRRAGEGTGRETDLDWFDGHYLHLFVWNHEREEIVGAYRLGETREILSRHGLRGLYSSTLFDFDERLFHATGPALELGRSFVRPEYQRQFSPLLMLWRGIGRYVASRPDAPVLFGPVSISNGYHPMSRQLMVRFLETQAATTPYAALVRPKRPFRTSPVRAWDGEMFSRVFRDLEELAEPIADIEGVEKGVPVLLRQYIRLGGKVLAFSVDPHFSNALDGLILVDLRETDRAVLDRHMGREAASRFLATHGR
ncbi:MAG: lysophospholipid acyltransferase family protein [Bryobacterales bacterium]|nr:lysophospholipid acyltransferase family protein [Bryobacterales bacterium]